ncbi:hypothetical protein BD410DRAFT_64614 [Rickenella mellea]|uniref:Heme haloperoxidase family profile domain-containing protein n=1 Tax=Rickenella mellea TaxID=50990 RepID=A0A4Y7QBN5_9AGAM|nr:hypothetical protein BD410DRAFT_64614 [Rickenella mellea]
MLLDNEHPFIAPTSGDSRSLCPVLNALANHGYLNRDGKDVAPHEIASALHTGLGLSMSLAHSMSANAFISETIPTAKNYAFKGVFAEGETRLAPRKDLAEIWRTELPPAEGCEAFLRNLLTVKWAHALLQSIKEHDDAFAENSGVRDRSESVVPPPDGYSNHATLPLPSRIWPYLRIKIHELYEADLMRENLDMRSLDSPKISDKPHSKGLRKWELFVMVFGDAAFDSEGNYKRWIHGDTLTTVLRDQRLPEPVARKVREQRNFGHVLDLEDITAWISLECRGVSEGCLEAEGRDWVFDAIRKLGPVWWRK